MVEKNKKDPPELELPSVNQIVNWLTQNWWIVLVVLLLIIAIILIVTRTRSSSSERRQRFAYLY